MIKISSNIILKKIEKLEIIKFKMALKKYINKLLQSCKNYKIFKDENEIKQWGNDNFSKWIEEIKSDREIYNIVEYYAGFYYSFINRYLRGYKHVQLNVPNTDEYQYIWKIKAREYSNKLNRALSLSHLNENIIVFRCLSYEGLTSLTEGSRIKTGMILQENGFMSTSLKYEYAEKSENDVILIIEVPKIAKGAYIDQISCKEFESEFLFCSGQKIEIIEIVYNKNRKYILLCELIK